MIKLSKQKKYIIPVDKIIKSIGLSETGRLISIRVDELNETIILIYEDESKELEIKKKIIRDNTKIIKICENCKQEYQVLKHYSKLSKYCKDCKKIVKNNWKNTPKGQQYFENKE